MAVRTADIDMSYDGEVAKRVGIFNDRFALKRPRTILLVHGFNVSGAKAVHKLEAFRGFLSAAFQPLEHEVFTSHWAGRHALAGSAYPLVIPRAKDSGKTLAKAIAEWHAEPGRPELVIVAHSLGCRVVLEALRHLRWPTGLESLTVVLMAAAVPVGLLAPEGALAGTLARMPPGRKHTTYIFHSRRDLVLAGVFRVGETLAGEGAFPVAVGLHGLPGHPAKLTHDMRPRGHGAYWEMPSTALDLCKVLGITVSAAALEEPLTKSPILPISPDRITAPLPFAS